MSAHIEALAQKVEAQLQGRARRVPSLAEELCIEVDPADLTVVCITLRDHPELKFEQLMDVAGVDYLTFSRDEWQTQTATRSGFSRGRVPRPGPPEDSSEAASDGGRGESTVSPPAARFAVAYQLLSVTHNERLRVRTFCENVEEPTVDSLVAVWACANWFEREVFDLFGIVFREHPDLRRILTDYGFIGHPFRKDFPLIGNVEVRYDPEKGRVVYEPVSIEARVLVPKVIREDHRYDPSLKIEIPAK
jgi:NADH-quinone oxidoreductase subunit C